MVELNYKNGLLCVGCVLAGIAVMYVNEPTGGLSLVVGSMAMMAGMIMK